MRPGYDSSWGDSEGECPSAPPDLDASYEDYSDVPAPRWVQRIYGPPPARPPSAMYPVVPAQVWSPGGDIVEVQAWQNVTPVAPVPAGHYDIRAYTPGILPYPMHHTPGAGLRARSPSMSTFQEAGTANSGDIEAPVQGSPTKTPLLVTPGPGKQPGRPKFSGQDPTMPSRAEGIKARRRQQLRTYDKDSFGVPLPNTARPFSIFASPFSVAEVCTGLGVYLASLQATVLLAVLLSICMIYPLVDNIKSQRWAKEYTLYTGVSSE